jgi:hypothetical protein
MDMEMVGVEVEVDCFPGVEERMANFVSDPDVRPSRLSQLMID